MILDFDVTIPTLTGDEPRKIYIYLPVGYDDMDEKRYPVLYMFDGHNLFDDDVATYGRSWRMGDYLDYTKTQVIIASVECNHRGNMRLSEYSPLDFSYYGQKIKGRGKKYMDWLTKSFKPDVDESFKTLPDRANTAIAGSSMGGLMSLYALLKYGSVFSKAAALSPSLWVMDDELSMLQNAKIRKNTILFMDYGSEEFKNHEKQKNLYIKAEGLLLQKGALLTSRIVPGGTHSEESWEREIPYFISVLGYTQS